MIKEIIENKQYVSELLSLIINRIHQEGPVRPDDFEKLAYIKMYHEKIFKKRETELLYIIGLFYKVGKPKSLIEEAYSIFSKSIKDETGENFTPVQADAWTRILGKNYFSFSAPTSAGKSYLFKELIIREKGDIVIVVPSRALIAEYISAIKQIVDKKVLVLQFIDNLNIDLVERRVFVITPERGRDLFVYKSIFKVGLVLFDEAQLSEEEMRGLEFDAFVRRVAREFPRAIKVFAHPYVKNPEAQLKKHALEGANSEASTYEHNAVGKIFMANDNGKLYHFSPYGEVQFMEVGKDIVEDILKNLGTILIYTSKAKLYSNEYVVQYRKYLKFCPKLVDKDALKFVEQLREYIGARKDGEYKRSLLVYLMERGVVIHHGSMPLKMRLIIEKFVRGNHARLCFATSTLKQGINMPFDAVYIDNYTSVDTLTMKNLIGRAGRSTNRRNYFDYGYTIIDKSHVNSFVKRINEDYRLKETSNLDDDISEIDEDDKDLVEAIKSGTFNNDSRLTETQLERIKHADIAKDIKLILDNMIFDDKIITGKEYYSLPNAQRSKVKEAFKTIYTSHLRRKELVKAEKSILSTAIPILLWQIQGKSFKEILALRYSYLTKQTEQRRIMAALRNAEITLDEAQKKLDELTVQFSQAPTPLPNKNARTRTDFEMNTPTNTLEYDTLVYDTYDYIDKVINLSLSDPICAAFMMYFQDTQDDRARIMSNYIRYGTNDADEIWLLRYGFDYEDILWLKDYIYNIDERKIIFMPTIAELGKDERDLIQRYIQ